MRTPATCYRVTEREIFSIPFTRPEGVEISNMLDVSMRWGESLRWCVMGGMCMNVPLRKGFGGGGVFFEDRKEICEIVLFISPHFCLCLSVCLSYPVGSNWIDMCQLSRLQSLESRVPNPVVKQRHARQMVPLCILLKVFCVIVCVPR